MKEYYAGRFSISLIDYKNESNYGSILYIDPDSIFIEGDNLENITKGTTYLYYSTFSNEIIQCSFNMIDLDFDKKIDERIYKYKILQLDDEQKIFLANFDKFENQKEKVFHKSNKSEYEFELAFNLINPRLLDLIEKYPIKAVVNKIIKEMNLTSTIFENKSVSRIYIGHEFCERLIPDFRRIELLFEKAKQENLEVTFVTPNLYQRDIEKLKKTLNFIEKILIKNEMDCEIVFNNWGTYELIKNNMFFKLVIGKQLLKYKRDPRIDFNHKNVYTPYQNELAKGDLENIAYRNYLTYKKVNRAEIDTLPQGTPSDLIEENDISYTLHFPFYNSAISRMCVFGVLNREPKTMWEFDAPCKMECRKFRYRIDFTNTTEVKDQKYSFNKAYMKGKAMFGKINNWEEYFDFDDANQKNVNRIVLYHEMPY